jgi:hypothetical protein
MSAWRIRSRVDGGALEKACAGVAERNDTIQTTYRVLDGALVAEVSDRGEGLVQVDATRWTPRGVDAASVG